MALCTCPCRCGARAALAQPSQRIAISVLSEAVASECGIGIEQLLGESRRRQFARPRQLLYLLARQHSGLSLQRIGQLLRHRDHSTVIHGASFMANLVMNDPDWADTAQRALDRARRIVQRRIAA